MDFNEDHWGIISMIIIILVAVCVIVANIACKKSGGVIIGGGRSPMYCVKKDAIIGD